MRNRIIPCLFFLLIIWISDSSAQSYVWPTDASYYLSSSFAEFRYGHFHAGIDIKTHGRTGYPVYATRSGYIWRIKVSPYGYGRVIYQKLDTGEIVLYAHLERFMQKLEAVVAVEQEKKQDFSINKYFKPRAFPVEQGEIIAYTGESGIGPPHLHFEIRDKDNRPINPLAKGFPVIDTQSPVIKRLAVVPLADGTEIEGKCEPLILTPIALGHGKYKINQPIRFSGQIGLAVISHDPINFSTNKLGVYRIQFYLDENLIFSAQYDRFSYAQTKQIFLDRDFRLMRRGSGIFYKCYRDYDNDLSFYKPFPKGAGMLNAKHLKNQSPAEFVESGSTSTGSTKEAPLPSAAAPIHDFRIELTDFHGNQAELTGQIVWKKLARLEPRFEIDDQQRFFLTGLSESNWQVCKSFHVYLSNDRGNTWTPLYNWYKKNTPLTVQTTINFKKRLLTKIYPTYRSSRILKIVARDTDGHNFQPFFNVLKTSSVINTRKAFIELKKNFYDDFVHFQVHFSMPAAEKPRMIIEQNASPALPVVLEQSSLCEYQGYYPIIAGKDGPLRIEISAQSIDDRGIFYEEQFNIHTIQEGASGNFQSKDGYLQVSFQRGSVYHSIFGRIEENLPEPSRQYEFVGQIYQIEPSDVPLNEGVDISIRYPEDYAEPEKLGIYTKRKNSKQWRFSGNKLDQENHRLKTSTRALNLYTIIKDIDPPEIYPVYPINGTRTSNRQPVILVKITDKLSGTTGNSQYMRLLLDNKRLISEYIPETKQLRFQPKAPLATGKHVLHIKAQDRCRNAVEKTINFWIL